MPKFLNYFSYLNYNSSDYDDANRLFIYHVLRNHFNHIELGYKGVRIPNKAANERTMACLKDPGLLLHFKYLNKLFPNAKILYLVRDGRDVAYSTIRKLKLAKSTANFMVLLRVWNEWNEMASQQCQLIGESNCFLIRYEDFVTNKKNKIKEIVHFLGIRYVKDLLNHEKYVGSMVLLERKGWSNDDVSKKVNQDALKSWVSNIEYDKYHVNKTIYMLEKLGYSINFTDTNDGKRTVENEKIKHSRSITQRDIDRLI